jgi:putative ABC transport system substrate-binding protein
MIARRDFITLLGGAAAWPVAARAQQLSHKRRIGVQLAHAESDPEALARVTAFRQGLKELGWMESHNVQIEYRWGTGDPDRARTFATELVALHSDYDSLA